MTKIINIDMDGCLCNFNGRMRELTSKTFEEFSDSTLAWDATGDAKKDIYLGLEVLENAKELVDLCKWIAFQYGYELAILTGIPKHNRIPNAEEHKRIWIKNNFPELYPRFKLGPFSEDKWKHCYNKYDILIDDFHKNIDQWNAVNGRGILHKHWDFKATTHRLYELVNEDK